MLEAKIALSKWENWNWLRYYIKYCLKCNSFNKLCWSIGSDTARILRFCKLTQEIANYWPQREDFLPRSTKPWFLQNRFQRENFEKINNFFWELRNEHNLHINLSHTFKFLTDKIGVNFSFSQHKMENRNSDKLPWKNVYYVYGILKIFGLCKIRRVVT